jgi:hypothetical protein
MTGREFEEGGQDWDCIRLRMAAICEGNPAMADAIEARENPTGFLG